MTPKVMAEMVDKMHLVLRKPVPDDAEEILVKIIKRPSTVLQMIGICKFKQSKDIDRLVESEEWF